MKKSGKRQAFKVDLTGVSKGQKRLEQLVVFLMIAAVITISVLLAALLYRLSETMIIYYFEDLLHLSAGESTFLIFLIYFFITLIISILVFIAIYVLVVAPFYELSNAIYKVSHNNYNVDMHAEGGFGLVNRTFRNFGNMCEKLSSVQSLQDDFIAMVSHEIKTPISVINGYAELLQDDEIPPEKKKYYINRIIENSSQISSITQDILLISKLENQKVPEEKSFFSLDNQIRKTILLMEEQRSEKDIRFNLFLEDINIYANEGTIYHIWRNLISNAIKFSNNGGAVTVSCRLVDKSTVQVEVVDSGCGMNEDVQEHIFEKFYQADTSHGSRGNGLGLALTKRIVDMYQSEISVRSAPGEGSVFTVLLKNCCPTRPRPV